MSFAAPRLYEAALVKGILGFDPRDFALTLPGGTAALGRM